MWRRYFVLFISDAKAAISRHQPPRGRYGVRSHPADKAHEKKWLLLRIEYDDTEEVRLGSSTHLIELAASPR